MGNSPSDSGIRVECCPIVLGLNALIPCWIVFSNELNSAIHSLMSVHIRNYSRHCPYKGESMRQTLFVSRNNGISVEKSIVWLFNCEVVRWRSADL